MNTEVFNLNAISKYRNVLYVISISWIMIYHFTLYFPNSLSSLPIINKVILSGNCGVDIFLFLSGVSLYFSMKKGYSTKDFYIRRFSKIAKVYCTICLVYYVYSFLIKELSPKTFIRAFLFINVNKDGECFWFILVISVCYVLYPAIFKLLENIKSGTRIIVAIEVIYVFILLLAQTLWPNIIDHYEIVLCRLPVFILGCLAGKAVYNNEPFRVKHLVSLVAFTIIYMLFYYYTSRNRLLVVYNQILYRFRLSVFALIILAFLLFVFNRLNFSTTKFINMLSGITLELYVFHVCIKNVSYGLIVEDSMINLVFWNIIWFFTSVVLSYIYNRIMSKL